MPPEHARAALEADYRHMQNMIFGPHPPFSEILNVVRDLEREIHEKQVLGAQLDAEASKGLDDIASGRTRSLAQTRADLTHKFGL